MMENERRFYEDYLVTQVLPFWEHAFDEEFGGLFTCWTNDGVKLVSTDKYTWSQARMLWCLSYMLLNRELTEETRKRYIHWAKGLYDLLSDNALLAGDDEGCAFLLERDGSPKEPNPGSGLYTSIYADCFVIMAFGRWAEVTSNAQVANQALALYEKSTGLIKKGIIKTDPYPIEAGHRSMGVHMILANTASELATALAHFNQKASEQVAKDATVQARLILDEFVDRERMQLREVVSEGGSESSTLERHRNPGHSVECMWFLLDILKDERVDEMERILLNALHLGWDGQYGGLLRYVDCEGGAPAGKEGSDAFTTLVKTTWDYKLWWPHAEALWATWRCYQATGNEELLTWYHKIKDYTFQTFPAEQGMEWIQIRRRDGEAQEGVVALPVKDPYHIIRILLFFTTGQGVQR